MVTFTDVSDALKTIKPYIHRTPVLSSGNINEMLGADIFFKCENFQKVGAFKYRGATNAVLSIPKNKASYGVATHSSGNHAQALALAAKIQGIRAHIVMPSNSPQVKKNAVEGYGAEITYCEPTLEARESTLSRIVDSTGAEEVHPYNDPRVIAGQGTSAMELFEEIHSNGKRLDILMTPVGGGGLLSGSSIASKELSPSTEVIAAEPEGADDAFRSLQVGAIVPSINPNTICDGLLTSLGSITFGIISRNVNSIVTVSDELVIRAMKLIYERLKIVIEPSSAVCLAAILKEKDKFKGKRIGIILSGGNIDLSKIGKYFN